MNFDDLRVVAYAEVTCHFHEGEFKRSIIGGLPPRFFLLSRGSQPGTVREIDLELLVFLRLRGR